MARSAQPGQFVIVRTDETGERIPLTISDYDPEQGSVTIVTQALVSPRARSAHWKRATRWPTSPDRWAVRRTSWPSRSTSCAASAFSSLRAVWARRPSIPRSSGCTSTAWEADVIIGAKNKDMLIYTDAMRAVASELYIATDDGSEGFRGLVTDLIKELIDKQGKRYDV